MSDLRSDVALLYRRAGFGASTTELDAAVARGYEATVATLVAGLAGPDPAGDAVPLPELPPPTPKGDPAARKAARQANRAPMAQLQTWWLTRMAKTSTPLREKLVLLWSSHFATSIVKVADAGYMYRQNNLFRRSGAGRFETLAAGISRDPAMMIWLDLRTDVAGKPNENFAREFMELFTLGVGNYTQTDVTQAARAFTGWGFDPMTGDFRLRVRKHDNGTKVFLGEHGNFDGDDIVRIVCARPESARFIAAKLFSHLACPVKTTDPIVDDLVGAYGTGQDLTALVQAILLHPQFRSTATRAGLVKQPIEYVVGAAKALGIDPGAKIAKSGRSLLPTAAAMLAQVPFAPPNVGG
ncbi:MAG: DUF1800 domain-containing protein, partial [Actinobacteria bacterium]|nr:DUF1800 domain-containing protein [Actinomycetota bacterium]